MAKSTDDFLKISAWHGPQLVQILRKAEPVNDPLVARLEQRPIEVRDPVPRCRAMAKKAGLTLDQKKREALFRDFDAYQKRVQVAFRAITTQHRTITWAVRPLFA